MNGPSRNRGFGLKCGCSQYTVIYELLELLFYVIRGFVIAILRFNNDSPLCVGVRICFRPCLGVSESVFYSHLGVSEYEFGKKEQSESCLPLVGGDGICQH